MNLPLLNKYLAPNENWDLLCQRVSGLMQYRDDRELIYDDLYNLRWLPNCVSMDTFISVPSGITRLRDIDVGDGIPIMIDACEPWEATKKFDNGPQKARHIETEGGYHLQATHEHRLRIIDDAGHYVWRDVGELKIGDWLALERDFIGDSAKVPLSTDIVWTDSLGRQMRPVKLPDAMTPELAEWLGLYIGDGTLRTYDIRCAFYAEDRDSMTRWSELSEILFGLSPSSRKVKDKECVILYICRKALVDYLKLNKLTKTSSAQAEIPQPVLRGGRDVIRAFLRGLFDADGSVGQLIEITAASEKMIDQIQLLLLGLGIQSRKAWHSKVWRLTIRRNRDGKRFVESIGFISQRKNDKLATFVSSSLNVRGHIIPNQNAQMAEWYRALPIERTEFYYEIARFLIKGPNARNISEEALWYYAKQFPALLKSPVMRHIARGQIYLPITEIREIEEIETGDLHVPEKHTYLANGFVSHNSPCLVNGGRPGGRNLAACHAIHVEDSIKGIFDTVTQSVRIFKSGGGIGLEFSALAPHGTALKYAPQGIASGPVSFLRVFDVAAQVVSEGGLRRAAMLASLNTNHPDILDFIKCKETDGKLANFNMTVTMDDGPDGVKPEVWDAIVQHAWSNGEPGIAFLDTINAVNPCVSDFGRIIALNACSELPLYNMSSCILGSLVLPNLITDLGDLWDLRLATQNITRFLNRVIDVNHYPLSEIAQATRRTRDIGIGVMGFATLLAREGIPYTSKDALDLASDIISTIYLVASAESWRLAEQDGGYLPGRRRNARLTAIAPTGHISRLAGVSFSIYPEFTDAIKMTPEEHLNMVAAWQSYVDSSISYTVNIPNDATPATVDAVFRGAYERGIKVICVYRDGSREGQPCTADSCDVSGGA